MLLYPSVGEVADWLWSARQAGNGLLYGLADRSNGDPVYGYDLSVAADTASNVLGGQRLQPRRPAGRPGRATTPVRRTLAGAGRRSWPAPSTRRCAGPTASTSTASSADGAQSGHASQEANALALAYGVVPAADVAASAPTWPSLGIDLGPNHGLELLRALAAAGLPDAMVRTLTDASIPGWAHIVAAGGTFTWEVWRRAT